MNSFTDLIEQSRINCVYKSLLITLNNGVDIILNANYI